jgi:hypothetical protein
VIKDATPVVNPQKSSFSSETTTDDSPRLTKSSSSSFEVDINSLVSMTSKVVEYITPLFEVFSSDKWTQKDVVSTFGVNYSAFGVVKLSIFELFVKLFELLYLIYSTNNSDNINTSINDIIKRLIKSGVFISLDNYLYQYEWNNIYQNHYEKLYHYIVNKYTPEVLIKHLFIDCKILNEMTRQAFTLRECLRHNTIFPGYFSCLCEVAYLIQTSDNIYLKSMLTAEWNEVVRLYLSPMRKKYLQKLECTQSDSLDNLLGKRSSSSFVKAFEDRVFIEKLKEFRNCQL